MGEIKTGHEQRTWIYIFVKHGHKLYKKKIMEDIYIFCKTASRCHISNACLEKLCAGNAVAWKSCDSQTFPTTYDVCRKSQLTKNNKFQYFNMIYVNCRIQSIWLYIKCKKYKNIYPEMFKIKLVPLQVICEEIWVSQCINLFWTCFSLELKRAYGF